MKDIEEKNVPQPEEKEPARLQVTDEQERQFWLNAKYSDASQDSER